MTETRSDEPIQTVHVLSFGCIPMTESRKYESMVTVTRLPGSLRTPNGVTEP